MKKSNLIFWTFLLLSINININCDTYLINYLTSSFVFDKTTGSVVNSYGIQLQHNFNKYVSLNLHLIAGFSYDISFLGENSISGLSLYPLIDELFFQFDLFGHRKQSYLKEPVNTQDGKHFDSFSLRFGRIKTIIGSGFYYKMSGDGVNIDFSVKNFGVNFFTITNSLDYLSLFNLRGSSNRVVFTRWDLERVPSLINLSNEGNINGFISNPYSSKYNYFFSNIFSKDYSSDEIERLNNLRYLAVLSGRIFTGLSFNLSNIYYQNFSINFTGNIDLIPNDFILTNPSLTDVAYNTFGGKYSSVYIGFNANGKIVRGLYYNFDIVYETGTNATYFKEGTSLYYEFYPINSFAVKSDIYYYFNYIMKPAMGLSVMFGSGDKDAIYPNNTVLNKKDHDNGFRPVFNPDTGYVVTPYLTNLVVISFNGSFFPLALTNNRFFSGFFLKNDVNFYLRPIVEGQGMYSEKLTYILLSENYNSTDKIYLGTEIDMTLIWNFVSDFGIELKGGVFIPNYTIYEGNDIFWKVGINVSMTF